RTETPRSTRDDRLRTAMGDLRRSKEKGSGPRRGGPVDEVSRNPVSRFPHGSGYSCRGGATRLAIHTRWFGVWERAFQKKVVAPRFVDIATLLTSILPRPVHKQGIRGQPAYPP